MVIIVTLLLLCISIECVERIIFFDIMVITVVISGYQWLSEVISGVENNFIHIKTMVAMVIDGYLWLLLVITVYLKRMVKRRNKYSSLYYRNGRRPVQPKTK